MGPVTDLQSATAEALRDFVTRIRAGLGAHFVDARLFGSVARGDARPDSDIDVLVVVQPHAERRQLEDRIIDIAFDVNLAHDLYISPRVVTRDILEDPVWRETHFVRTLERESVPL
jgi:predicted nucleotidyltransferase